MSLPESRRPRFVALLTAVLLGLSGALPAVAPLPAVAQTMVPVPPAPRPGLVTAWTLVADRLGDGTANWRSLAVMHIAMHDALNAAEPRFARFAPPAPGEPPAAGASPAVAMAAAFQVLLARHPTRAAESEPVFQVALAAAAGPTPPAAMEAGIALGAAIGLATVTRLTAYNPPVELFPVGEAPGQWRATPPLSLRGAVGDYRPLLAENSASLRGPPPPPLDSPLYLGEVDEVRRLGVEANSERTPVQTEAALFWASQTTQRSMPHLAVTLLAARPMAGGLWAEARLMAQLAAGLADSFVVAWDEKRRYAFWRPITAINLGSPGVTADPCWEPLVLTPPHPDFPSGHSTDCSTGARILAVGLGGDTEPVTYVAVDATPPTARQFPRIEAAAEECALSRIWAGVHFRAASDDGLRLGAVIAGRALAMAPPVER